MIYYDYKSGLRQQESFDRLDAAFAAGELVVE